LADRDIESGGPAAVAKKLYRALTRDDVLAGVYILVLCAVFVLETRGLRNLFYAVALPVFLVNLTRLDWRAFWQSPLVRLVVAYLGYVLVSALWSRGLTWAGFADLLRLTVLVFLFFATTVQLALRDDDFPQRLFFWFALAAGATALAALVPAVAGALTVKWRLEGFGLASHPIIGATLYGFALLATTFVLLPRARTLPARLLWLAVITACAAFILLAASRGPLLALAAAFIIGLALADRRLTLTVIAIFAVAFAAGMASDFRAMELIFTRSQSGHFLLWQQAIGHVAEAPWFGHGSLSDITFENKHGLQRSPHNLLLANQFYGGIPATLLLAAVLALAGWRAIQTARNGLPILLVLLVFGVVASLFDSRSLVQNLGREWITLWLPIALATARPLRGPVGPPS
jgi:O-antigen ligase